MDANISNKLQEQLNKTQRLTSVRLNNNNYVDLLSDV